MLHRPLKQLGRINNKKTKDIEHVVINDKVLLKDLQPQLLKVLSYYPELKDTRIRFKYTSNALFPYASRPNWKTMFRKKKDWEYLILISKKSSTMNSVLLHHLTFEAQVGVLGHELAHTADYQKMNIFQIALLGAIYFIPSFRKRFENKTDKAAIAHGLGWQLYEFNRFVCDQKDFISKNKWFLKYYLSSKQILQYLDQFEAGQQN